MQRSIYIWVSKIKEINFILAKQGKKYVAVVESSTGIIANTVPSKDKEIHLNFLRHIQSKLGLKSNKILTSNTTTSDILFSLEKDPLVSWTVSKNFPIDFALYTKKQQVVAEQLRNIPLGQKVSYGELAELSGITRGARFVGNCMSSNYIPLIIPCHRVVKSDGSLGNYSAGGPEVKIKLLRQEGVAID